MHLRPVQKGRRSAIPRHQRPQFHPSAQGFRHVGRDRNRSESRESIRTAGTERMREEYVHEGAGGPGGADTGKHRRIPPERRDRGVGYGYGFGGGDERRRGEGEVGGGGREAQSVDGDAGRARGSRRRGSRGRGRGRDDPGGTAGEGDGTSELRVRAAGPAGRRDGGEEGEGDTDGVGIHARDAGEIHEGFQRRVEDEGQPGQGAVHTAHAPPSRRADEPPGHGGRNLAGGLPLPLGQDPPPHLPLPGLPQQRHVPHHPLHQPPKARVLRRQLRSIRQDQVREGGEPDEAVQLGAGSDEIHEGVHRPVRARHLQERQAGTIQAEGAGQDDTGRIDREARTGKAHEFQIPGSGPSAPSRPGVPRRHLRVPGVRTPLLLRQFRRRPRQPRRPRGSQRSRQDHAREAHVRGASAQPGGHPAPRPPQAGAVHPALRGRPRLGLDAPAVLRQAVPRHPLRGAEEVPGSLRSLGQDAGPDHGGTLGRPEVPRRLRQAGARGPAHPPPGRTDESPGHGEHRRPRQGHQRVRGGDGPGVPRHAPHLPGGERDLDLRSQAGEAVPGGHSELQDGHEGPDGDRGRQGGEEGHRAEAQGGRLRPEEGRRGREGEGTQEEGEGGGEEEGGGDIGAQVQAEAEGGAEAQGAGRGREILRHRHNCGVFRRFRIDDGGAREVRATAPQETPGLSGAAEIVLRATPVGVSRAYGRI
mmetsp:Transcript_14800/g.30331  ORF Transcript_14800/g.30331 Transcript_14800/m.30331 type:complete len:700 (-) Transcript_14800:25-2124(-)